MTRIGPLGDRGFLARFESEDQAAAWAEGVRASGRPGLADVVTAYRTVGLHADPDLDDLEALGHWLETFPPPATAGASGRLVTVPVLYDGEDLGDAAVRLGISPEEVVRVHGSVDYRVFAIGFRPGFPYAGYLPEPIAGLPRRESPRTRVPAGSVAIVGRQSAIYPSPSPGGWHLIGTTPLRIADVEAGFFPIRAGDRLRFVSIDRDEFEARLGGRIEP